MFQVCLTEAGRHVPPAPSPTSPPPSLWLRSFPLTVSPPSHMTSHDCRDFPVLSDVLLRMLKVCETHHIKQEVPRPLQTMINLISRQTPQSRFHNSRKGKGSKHGSGRPSVCSICCYVLLLTTHRTLSKAPYHYIGCHEQTRLVVVYDITVWCHQGGIQRMYCILTWCSYTG